MTIDPSFGNLARLDTLMSSDRTKQISLWMTIYIYIYIYIYMCVCVCVCARARLCLREEKSYLG